MICDVCGDDDLEAQTKKSAFKFDEKSYHRILKCTFLLNKSKYCEKISISGIYNKLEKDL